MSTLSEQDFRVQSDVALEAARRALLPLADSEGFEVELQNVHQIMQRTSSSQ